MHKWPNLSDKQGFKTLDVRPVTQIRNLKPVLIERTTETVEVESINILTRRGSRMTPQTTLSRNMELGSDDYTFYHANLQYQQSRNVSLP